MLVKKGRKEGTRSRRKVKDKERGERIIFTKFLHKFLGIHPKKFSVHYARHYESVLSVFGMTDLDS